MDQRQPSSPSGIILLDKPKGLSSNQALGRVKRLFGIKKAGHTGTLDPMATGLLVICLGHATRMCAYLMDADKSYEARVHLGVVTDTEDAEGQVIATHSVPVFSHEEIEAVLASFVGQIEQIPPMYSALKHQGERLYALARRGESVERPARAIRIDAVQVIDWALDDANAPGFTLRVDCSKGTYIRSLVRDIGEALGCGAHLSALRRTRAEPFVMDDAKTLDELNAMSAADLEHALLPVHAAVPQWPLISLKGQELDDFRHGRLLSHEVVGQPALGMVCVLAEGECVGLAECTQQGIQPRAVFV